VAGDAEEIAEASAAMFNGKVKGMEIVKSLQQITSSGPESSDASTNPGVDSSEDLQRKADILKSRPGRIVQENYHEMVELKVYPVLHCLEEIPCNPCITVCKQESIQLENKLGDIRDLPFFQGECNGCARCVAICPGLAITMVDKRKAKPGKAHVVIPFELLPFFQEGDQLELCDTLGQKLGQGQVVKFRNKRWQDRTALVTVEVPLEIAPKVAGIAMQDKEEMLANFVPVEENQISQESPVVCRCERVRKEKVLEMKALGVQDMNHLKTIRCSMGACGGKTCIPLIKDIYAREGGEPCELIEPTLRPLNAEVTLSVFAGAREKKGTKLK